MSAVSCSRLCRGVSTGNLDWLQCHCGLSCSKGWMGLELQMPSPGLLLRHRQWLVIILHPEDQTCQSGVPGLQTDDPQRPSDVPEGWMNLGILHVPVHPSKGLPHQNPAPEMLHLSTFLQRWTLKTKSRTERYPTRKMMRAPRRKCQLFSTSCSDRLWLHPKAFTRSTLPSLAGLPGHHWWILERRGRQTEFPGWINHLWSTPWRLQHVSSRASRTMRMWRRQLCQRSLTPAPRLSNICLSNRYFLENLIGLRSIGIPNIS